MTEASVPNQRDDEVRVLIVDDSALYRQSIARALKDASGIRVVGTAANGHEAIERIVELRPDLMTLDVQMPEMDGIETLREIGRRKLQVAAVMVSSLTESGARTTLDALFEGAFDFIHKPTGGLVKTRDELKNALTEKIDAYRTQRQSRGRQQKPNTRTSRASIASPVVARDTDRHDRDAERKACDLVLIGLSTGGPQALRHVLPRLAGDFPVPIVIVQHMPPNYTKTMAERLDQVSELSMREAAEGDVLAPGNIYLAPGDKHLRLNRRGDQVVVRLTSDPPENSCRPAVDYTIRSAVDCYGSNTLTVIMTGMGKDGMKGCQLSHSRGGVIFAQDEDTSAVYGMPKAVICADLTSRVLPLGKIAPAMTRHVHRTIRSRSRSNTSRSNA